MNEDLEAQEDELLALGSIFGPEVLVRAADDGAPSSAAAAGELRVSVELPQDFFIAVKDGDTFVYFGISSLPPLTVRFELPADYPSSARPSSTLTCGWLTHTQICALNTHLADLYQATGGAVVLFSWVQFLKEDTLSFLGINSLLVLPSNEHSPTSPYHPRSPDGRATQIEETHDDDNYDDDTSHLSTKSTYGSDRSTSKKLDPCCSSSSSSSSAPAPPPPPPPPSPPAAAVPSPSASQTKSMLSAILVHDEAAKQRRFADSVLDCGVCLAPVLGSQCMVFRDCGHVHCEPCLAQCCTVQIKEGNVRAVTCPQPGCKVRTLVGDELFHRYDRLLFQATLDSMTDVVYCPRVACASAVIMEPDGDMAHCSVCSFAFCVSCRQSYHGTSRCPNSRRSSPRPADAEPDYRDIPQSLVGMMALWEDYSGGSGQRKKLLEKRYGTHILRTTMAEYLNEGWCLQNETKDCPHCSATIQKNGGCNHMHCAMCDRSFQWDSSMG